MSNLRVSLAVLLFSFTLHAQERTRVEVLGTASLKTVAATKLAVDTVPHGRREHMREQPAFVPEHATPLAVQRIVPEAAATAPRLATTFGAMASGEIYPPDASGAVGPHDVVSIFNAGVVVQDRSGANRLTLTLRQFWNDSSRTTGLYYDTRVAYDAAADRWVAMGLYDENETRGALLFGASQTGDPTGAWNRYAVRIDPNDPSALGDFSKLAITRDTVLMETNLAASGGVTFGSRVYVLPKTGFYAGSISTVQSFNSLFVDLTPVSGDLTRKLLTISFPGVIALMEITDTGIKGVGSFTASFVWDEEGPGGKQFGGQVVDTGWSDVQVALWRNGTIYGTNTVFLGSGRGSILYWKVSDTATNGEAFLLDDPTGAITYAYPYLAVNRNGAWFIGFCRFSATAFASAGYLYRDASGNTITGTVKDGETTIRVDRWGDYTTTVVDPTNDTDFWTLGLYPPANPPNALWGSLWAKYEPGMGKRRVVRH